MVEAKLNSWTSKRQGSLNRFYTRDEIGALLTREIGEAEIKSVLDLGAGEGSLSAAISRRWPDAEFQTVDIDTTCVADLHETLTALGVSKHQHLIADVLNVTLPQQLGRDEFDLAVCNPPFFRPEWNREFADILQKADFSEACPTINEVTAEILFLAQILRLLRVGGTIALIVPDGLATGWRAKAFRTALLSKHTLRTVIQLPPYSFHSTEAYCFILVLTKGKSPSETLVKLLKQDGHSRISEPIWINRAIAANRMDWVYHSALATSSSEAITLRGLGADIRRGSLSSVERRAAEFEVFHTGDFPTDKDKVQLKSGHQYFGKRKVVIAEEGDILLARVDRYLHNKITFVASGQAPITDCVYRIRLPEQHRKHVFEALSSERGRASIRAVTKGVGARLLGKGDLLDIALDFSTINAL